MTMLGYEDWRGVPALPPGKIHNLTSETFDTLTQRWWLAEEEK